MWRHTRPPAPPVRHPPPLLNTRCDASVTHLTHGRPLFRVTSTSHHITSHHIEPRRHTHEMILLRCVSMGTHVAFFFFFFFGGAAFVFAGAVFAPSGCVAGRAAAEPRRCEASPRTSPEQACAIGRVSRAATPCVAPCACASGPCPSWPFRAPRASLRATFGRGASSDLLPAARGPIGGAATHAAPPPPPPRARGEGRLLPALGGAGGRGRARRGRREEGARSRGGGARAGQVCSIGRGVGAVRVRVLCEQVVRTTAACAPRARTAAALARATP